MIENGTGLSLSAHLSPIMVCPFPSSASSLAALTLASSRCANALRGCATLSALELGDELAQLEQERPLRGGDIGAGREAGGGVAKEDAHAAALEKVPWIGLVRLELTP